MRQTMILSNVSTYSIEDVTKTLGTPPWQQLYMPRKWEETEKMVKRIEDTGCPVLVWTVDNTAGRNTPTMTRFARQDTRDFVREGLPQTVAMKLTGHLTDSVFRRYDIVSPNDLRVAAERLAGRG